MYDYSMATLRSTLLFNDANLKAYYEHSAGALLVDSSPNGNTLTNNNTVAEGTGKYGGGADFSATNTNKSLSVASNLGIDGGVISIVGWFQLKAEISSGNWYFAFQESATTDVGYFFDYAYNGGSRTLTFWRIREGIDTVGYTHSITMGTTDKYHLGLTYDGTNVRAYLNGSLIGTSASATGSGTGGVSAFRIGAAAGGAVGFASIISDDVAVFNRVLTADEIANLASDTGTTTSTSSSTSTTTTSTSTTTTSTSTTTTSTSTTTTSTSTTTTSTSSTTSISTSSSTSTTTTSTSTTTTSTSTSITTSTSSSTSTTTTSTSTTDNLVFYVEDMPQDMTIIVDHPAGE